MLIALIMHQNFVVRFYFSLAFIVIIIATIIVIINKVSKSFGNLNYKMDYYSYSVKIIIINNISLIMMKDVMKLAFMMLDFTNFTSIALNNHTNLLKDFN